MTTYRQPEYEALIQEIRAQEERENAESLGCELRPGSAEVRVSTNMAAPTNMLTDRELECITTVFRSFETGLRGATIYPSDLHPAMKMLGLNPSEQEVVDIPNNIAKKGLIYFPDFCQLILKWFRDNKEEKENFNQNMFKLLCGTDPFPKDFRAKKYKMDKHSITKADFVQIMRSLPVRVPDHDIEEMFTFADKDNDGKLSYAEFKIMIDPPAPPEVPKPSITELGLPPQIFSPEPAGPESALASPLLASSRVSSFFGSSASLSTRPRPGLSKASSVAGSTLNVSQTHV